MLTLPGNSGIGYETVQQLALRNARVYIGGRSKERVEKAIHDMNTANSRTLDLRFLQLDLQDLSSIRGAVERLSGMEQRLDILINNAGVGSDLRIVVTFADMQLGHVTSIRTDERWLRRTVAIKLPRAVHAHYWLAPIAPQVRRSDEDQGAGASGQCLE
jgi:NAD(P)-dependent dehydrogenase (short-subunit alcohol dehydrogenase family)